MNATFSEWLQKKKLRASTIREHEKNLRRFIQWCREESLNPRQATYNDLTAYIFFFQRKNLSPATINLHLRTLRLYYDHMRRKNNPAGELFVKGRRSGVLPELFTAEILEDVYQRYMNKRRIKGRISALTHERNLVVLGFMIYQGLHAGELSRLEVKDVNMEEGTVYIPSGPRWNSRTLKLQSVQILTLRQYLQHTRKELCKIRAFRQDKLLDGPNAHRIVSWLMRDLRLLTGGVVKSARQLRVSVLMNWLKQYNIRQVQYMIGHRHIGSTERYKIKSIENLQEQLKKHHPLGDEASA